MSNQKHFTDEQIAELEVIFNLRRVDETLPVRDGSIKKGDMVWWRAARGPEYVKSDNECHWHNIRTYPDVYQINKPRISVSYED